MGSSYTTEESLGYFAMRDWENLRAKLERCRNDDFKRCCNTYSESLRKSRRLDALTAFRTAHTRALGQYVQQASPFIQIELKCMFWPIHFFFVPPSNCLTFRFQARYQRSMRKLDELVAGT